MSTPSDRTSVDNGAVVLPGFSRPRTRHDLRTALLASLVLPTALALLMTGCSSGSAAKPGGSTNTSSGSAASAPSTSPSPSTPRDGTTIADRIKQATTTQVVTITAANDPNGKIGTATGYVSAAIIYDSGVTCDSLGVDCGATIEVYATADLAQARADYIKALSGIADEVDTVNGSAVLRATGKLPSATATAYSQAFSKG